MSTPLQDMRQLLKQDGRFKVEAYQFIRESLQYAAERMTASPNPVAPGGGQLGGGQLGDMDDDTLESSTLDEIDSADSDEPSPRHVTGGQLCHACRQYGLTQYGFLAPMVLASWGIRSTGDLGDLVYNLIRIGQMRKSESDRREDFDDVFDFDSAFEPEFEMNLSDDE